MDEADKLEDRIDKGVNRPHTIGSSLEVRRSSGSLAKTGRVGSTAKEVMAMLGKLALHYWRPDFSEQQAKLLFADFVEDLREYSPERIEAACTAYRRNPENRFFPTPGQLRACIPPLKVEAVYGSGDTRTSLNRPTGWYLRPRDKWLPEWREDEAPAYFRGKK